MTDRDGSRWFPGRWFTGRWLPGPWSRGVVAGVALRRWGVVVVLLALVVAVPATVAAWPVTPAAAVDPATLRDRVAASGDVAWSGYAESSAGLGLPRVSALSDVTTLLSGTTRIRAWYAAPDRSRVDQLSATGERDRYTTPDGQAVWDYGATLLTLVRRDPIVRLPRADDLLPPELARRLLSGTAPTDAVSALPARRVAGVDAAGVRVRVADPRTTVGALDVWADPVSGLPVDVEVVTKAVDGTLAAGPVLSTRFSSLEQGAPDPAALVIRRPPGAGLTRSPTSDLFGVLGRGDPRQLPRTVDGVTRERPQRGFGALGQYGTTLSQLVVVPLPADIAGGLLSGVSRAGSAGRTVPVSSGQAGALQSPLLSIAVVLDGTRGFAVAGLVAPDVLDRAANDVATAAAASGGRG